MTDAKQHKDRKPLTFVEIILKMMSEYITMTRGELCGKYTDEEVRSLPKITCKVAADYLGIASMAVSIGMRNDWFCNS